MSEIYLIRHSQASFGEADYDKLSSIGHRQSEVLARYLAAIGAQFDAIYCGRMKRHTDTAGPTIRALTSKPETLSEFDEYNAGGLIAARLRHDASVDNSAVPEPVDFEVLRADKRAFQVFFAETVRKWVSGAYDSLDDLESYPAFCERVEHGIRKIMNHNGSGRRVAVFTSGGPISVAVKSVLGLSGHKAMSLSWQVMNASITCLRYNGDESVLWGFNNISHLMLANDPSLLTYR